LSCAECLGEEFEQGGMQSQLFAVCKRKDVVPVTVASNGSRDVDGIAVAAE